MPQIDHVYVIFWADVVSRHTSNITGMAPAKHVPASIGGRHPEAAERIAQAFTETEDDEEYDFGYLGDECGDPRYYPFGYTDREGFNEPPSIEDVRGVWGVVAASQPVGMGMHRKWVGELSAEDWRVFCDAYNVELDREGFPTEYEDTMGSLTEYGHIPAVSIDMSEGWDYPGFGYGSVESVIDSRMYVSIATVARDHNHERGYVPTGV